MRPAAWPEAKRGAWLALLACFLAAPVPAQANDSEAAIGLGGLKLVRNAEISLEEQDLFISRQEIRVRYRFRNRSARDVEALVAFPVPELPRGVAAAPFDRSIPDYRQLQFRTTVDGRPAQLAYVERAMVGSRDVTARIAALGWPLRWYAEPDDPPAFIAGLSARQKRAHQAEGLLRPGVGGGIEPAWDVVTHITRRQVFPAGRSLEVTHRYVPLAGGSVGGLLDRPYRREAAFADYVRTYCLDRAFLAGFDRRQATVGREGGAYMEHWLRYLLAPGGNWRGPIGQFRLVVDKGRADNLVSFCMDGVRRISSTAFEVVKRNFEPRRDLDILIVEWNPNG